MSEHAIKFSIIISSMYVLRFNITKEEEEEEEVFLIIVN
jgi:hypothetical protein